MPNNKQHPVHATISFLGWTPLLLIVAAALSGCVETEDKTPVHVERITLGDHRYVPGSEYAQQIVLGIQLDGSNGDYQGERQ